MGNNEINNKLTSSAKSALDNYLTELRNDILTKAINKAKSNDEKAKEIRLTEIISAINDKSSNETNLIYSKTKNTILNKRKRFIVIGMFVGIVYSIIGFAYYFIKNNEINIENDFGLIAGFAGIFLTLITFLYGILLRDRTLRKAYQEESQGSHVLNKEYELLSKWKMIENQFRSVVSSMSDKDANTFSISNLIRFAIDKEIITRKDEDTLRALLSARNNIVHGHKENILKDSEIELLLKDADKMIQTIDSNLG